MVAAHARPRPRREDDRRERPQGSPRIRRRHAEPAPSSRPSSARGSALAGLFLDLVRVPPSGTWERRRADLYALAEDWVGPESATEADGIELLVRRYLQGFGPARPAEIADWASLDVKTTRQALERLELRRFQDEHGKELVDLPRLPLARRGHSGSGALPARLGRDAARPRAADADPSRAPPASHLQRPEPPIREHVPRRRPGRGHVALREGPRQGRAVRPAAEVRPRRADEEAERLAAFHA